MGEGEKYLHQRNDKLHQTEEVEKAVVKKQRAEERAVLENEEESNVPNYQKPEEKLQAYTERLQKVLQPHQVEKESEEEEREWTLDRGARNVAMLKSRMEEEGTYEELGIVMDPDNIKETYWERQKRLMEREGRAGDLPQDEEGNRYIPEEAKKQEIHRIQADQKSTFNTWLDYVGSEDSDYIPSWALVWALEGVRNSDNRYNEEKGQLNTRTKDTVNPYPELNPEALALSVEAIRAKVEEGEITETNPELRKAIESTKFQKVYGQYLEEVTAEAPETLENIEGSWSVYEQGSTGEQLAADIRGKNTGWCVGGASTAHNYLQVGDLHVYYSQDEEGQETVPRLAIHVLENGKIGEIRGVGKDQNTDAYIGPVLEEKLEEFGEEAEEYQEVQADVARLNRIVDMHEQGLTLDVEDLEFLYETREPILTHGQRRDTRIDEIKAERDAIEDYNTIFRQSGEVYEGDVTVYVPQSAEGLELPREIQGNLELRKLQSAEGLHLPETIDGDLIVRHLEDPEGLELPQEVHGNLHLTRVQSAEGLQLPETIGGDLGLPRLRSAQDLELPRAINGKLDLAGLEDTEGLELPQEVHGDLRLTGLQRAEGLQLPETVDGDLVLRSLRDAEGLTFPQEINGEVDLAALQSAEGLQLPETIGGKLILSDLENAEGLELPREVHGGLNLFSLKNAEGLKMPETVDGSLELSDLEHVQDLKLPETVDGDLILPRVRNAEGLELPRTVGGDLVLSSLQNTEGLELPQEIHGDVSLHGLQSAEGLHGLENFEGELVLGTDIEYVPREILDTCEIVFLGTDPTTERSIIHELYQECDRREHQEEEQRLEEVRSQMQRNEQDDTEEDTD